MELLVRQTGPCKDVDPPADGNTDTGSGGGGRRIDSRGPLLTLFFFLLPPVLQISLGSLLLLGNQPLCAGRTQCIGEEDIHHQLKRFAKSMSSIARPAGDLHSRSISPWKYK